MCVAVSLLPPGTASAEVLPNGRLEFSIEHEDYGDIGTHLVTMSSDNSEVVIRAVSRVRVKRFLWEYRLESDYTEVWRGGRLYTYEGVTSEGRNASDDAIRVSAQAFGDKLIIEGPLGRIEAPGTILSTHPWNPRIVDQGLLMHSRTGELKHVTVRVAADEWMQVGDKSIKARKYRMSGEVSRELWYDASGLCVQMRFTKRGRSVTFRLKSASLAATPDLHRVASARTDGF
jgi:hypothetical protein